MTTRGSRFLNAAYAVIAPAACFEVPKTEHQHPCLTPGGAATSLYTWAAFHFLARNCAFFAVRLLCRDLLHGSGFYTLDPKAPFRTIKNGWTGATALSQAYRGQVQVMRYLPPALPYCWHPFPRYLPALLQIMTTAMQDTAHSLRAPNRVAERSDMHATPLNQRRVSTDLRDVCQTGADMCFRRTER